MDKKWIVAVNTDFYPYITEHDTEEKALNDFEYEKNSRTAEEGDVIYLAEVKKVFKK